MHSSLLFLSLALLLHLVAAFPPPHLTTHRRASVASPPQERIEITRPLPIESLPLSCELPVLSHTFVNTVGLPPTNVTYSAPKNCTWTHAAIHLSAASNGSQRDRIAGVWISGAEILRTSTPEPTADGIFWNVRKDVTRYSSLLRQPNLTLSVMLENSVNDVYTAAYEVNLTIYYYNNVSTDAVSVPSNKSIHSSLELNGNPADLIIPLSASGEGGFWFKIENESNAVSHGIQIPSNTYRAVIEVYVSFHGDDEFWYSNPPNSFIEMNNLTYTGGGHGSYREIVVSLDNYLIGSVMPFPVIFAGGINPLFWEPIVSIGAFDLPSYEIELTPFLGTLLDRKAHCFGLGVNDAVSYWLVDANLHLWLDDKVDEVRAGSIKYDVPSTYVERTYKFNEHGGKFEVEGKGESEISGWVFSSFGNFTTHVTNKLEFENTIEFKKNGTEKSVKHEAEIKSKVQIRSADTGAVVSSLRVERKYPLEFKTTTLPGSGRNDNYLVITKLEQALKEEKEMEMGSVKVKSKLDNKQKSSGWMFVQDHDVLSGSARTEERIKVKDGFGCYTKRVSARGGSITTDADSFMCAAAGASFVV